MELDRDKAIEVLNRIMELELAEVVRYTHYALMMYDYNRIPICRLRQTKGWFTPVARVS